MTTSIDKLIAGMNTRHPVSKSGVMKPMNTAKTAAMHMAKSPAKKADPIHIKPKNRGKLHKKLGVPQGKKIPQAKIEQAEHSSSPALRKEAVFAENFGHAAPSAPSQVHVHVHMNDGY